MKGTIKRAIRFSFILTVLALSLIIFSAQGVLADTHSSTVTVDPSIVAGGEDDKSFEVKVCNTGGNDINRFSIYYEYGQFTDFTNVQCQPKTGWNDYKIYDYDVAEGWLCLYVSDAGNAIGDGYCETFEFTADTPQQECCRTLRFETRDVADYWQHVDTDICVDATPPETTKIISDPKKVISGNDPNEFIEWVDTTTTITLDATDCPGGCDPDGGPHDSGIDKTWYMNELFTYENHNCEPEDPCWDPYKFCYYKGDLNYPFECIEESQDNCDENWGQWADSWEECVEWKAHNFCDLSDEWKLYDGTPIQKDEESCHGLYYFSVDGVGNIEDVNANCFFVDKTPPIGEKEVGEPRIPIPDNEFQTIGDGAAEWTDLENYFGDYSARLYVPNGGSDIAAVEFDVDIALEDIEELSFWQKISNIYGVNVILGIDADGDGVYESQDKPWHFSHAPADLGDDSFIEMDGLGPGISSGNWEEVDTLTVSHWWTPDNNGDGWCAGYGWNPLSDFQTNTACRVEPTDHVKVIRLLIGGSGNWMDKVAYVDDITLNEKIIRLEPRNWWVRDHKTKITLSCEDQEPHPSGDEEVCYKVSYDLEPYDLTDQYCDENLEDGWCCVDEEATIIFEEDSLHDLEYFCRDAVDKKSEIDLEWFKVDSTPPIIEKTMFGNYLGDCPPEDCGEECYVADDGTSGVEITVEDPEVNGCAVDEVTCRYELLWESQKIDEGIFTDYKEIVFTEDSTHTLKIWCEDALGNEVYDEEVFLVDSEPPVTEKTYIPKPYIDPQTKYEYIDTIHEVKLTAEDEKVGVDVIQYRVSGALADRFCENCAGWMQSLRPDMGAWQTYNNPFKIEDESCHVIEYRSVDKLGNEEEIQWQCVFVDKKAPEITKEYEKGDPYYTDGTSEWINSQTTIIISATDPAPHPSGIAETKYRYDIVDDGYCGGTLVCEDAVTTTGWITLSDPAYGEFNIIDDSCHIIEIISKDNVGKESTHKQCVFVDNKKPEITKEIVGPQKGDCPPEGEDICYIDGITEIHVDVIDPEPHPVDEVTCDWDYEVPDGQKTGQGEQGLTPPFIIQFPEESTHILTITCRDALGNEVSDVEEFIVDKTAPETYKRYAGPQYSGGLPEYSFQTFSQDIEGSDYDLEVTVEDDGTWVVWTFDFPVEEFTGDGNLNVGLIIALDGEGNGPAFQIHNNDGADSGHDWGTWLMSPWGPTIGDGWNGWHSGDTNTPVTSLSWVEATGNRNVPHGNGILQVKILKSELGESFHWAASPTVGSGFWSAYDVTMQIPTAFGWSTPLVDMGVPNYIYAESVKGGYPKWINSETEIYLTATDSIGPHDSGVKATYWRNTIVDNMYCENQELCQQVGGSGEWNLYEGAFTKPQESCHLIEYYSIDNVDKTETIKKQCVFVDNTPPTPVKEVGQPKTEWDGLDSDFYPEETAHCWDETGEEIECWKVTLDTSISMTCEDPEPHPVDNERICFNVELDGEDWTESYCEENAYNGDMEDEYCCLDHTIGDFTFLESCEHNLKFYCEDALGNSNKEDLDEEKFKVEGNNFTIKINKKWNLISVPVVLLNPDIKEVIPDSMGDVIVSVWAYDPSLELCGDEWCVYTPDGNDMNDDLHGLVPGWGYWVLSLDETEIVIGGSLLSPRRRPPSRDLVEGWNLAGYYGLDDQTGYYEPVGNGQDVKCALGTLCGPLWFEEWSSVVTYWQPYSNPWVYLGRSDNMDPGAGYWLFMRDKGEYSVATSCCSLLGT